MRRLLKKKINLFGKEISVFVISLFAIALVSAALIPYFGMMVGTVDVSQGLKLDDKNWDDISIIYSDSLNSFETKKITSGAHILNNDASINAVVNLDTHCLETDCIAITTTHDSVGLSSSVSWVAGSGASAILDVDKVTLSADKSASESPWVSSEGRIRIDAKDIENLLGLVDELTLNDLVNISWDANVISGYLPHVDILIDIDGDGIYTKGVDDALVFEYAKVNPVNCDSGSYPTGGLNTFEDNGMVDDDAYAWFSSGPAGPCGDTIFENGHMSLSNWKLTGTAGIDGTKKIIAIEIEVDAWISDSESEISNIVINGVSKEIKNIVNPVSVNGGENLVFYVNSNFPKMLTPDTYTLTTQVNPA